MSRARTPATLESIAVKLDSLLRHVEALDSSVQKLAGRINPFDDEDVNGRKGRALRSIYDRVEPSPENIMLKIRVADDHVEAIERDTAAIRAYLTNIDGRFELRDELRRHIKNPDTQ